MAGTAVAYPPNAKLTVAAGPVTSLGGGEFDVPLTFVNAPPGCVLTISVKEKSVTQVTVPPASGTAGVSFSTNVTLKASGDDTSTIRVKTATCTPAESTKTKVLLREPHLEVPDECRKDKSCKVKAEHYPPGATVSFVAVRLESTPLQTIPMSKKADSNGDAKVEFSFPKEGTWTVTSTSGSVSDTQRVQVKKK